LRIKLPFLAFHADWIKLAPIMLEKLPFGRHVNTYVYECEDADWANSYAEL